MTPQHRLLSSFEAIVLVFAAAILLFTLLVPPIVGLADNGDFYKMMSKFGLEHGAQSREDRYFGYVDSIYVPDPVSAAHYQEVWRGTWISSEMVFMFAAVWLNRLSGLGSTFHLQYLGFVHLVAFLAGAWLLLIGTRSMSRNKRIAGAILALIMFLDVGYISYFNSAYTESSSILFLMLLLAGAMPMLHGRRYSEGWIVLYFLSAVLLCCSRYPNVILYPVLALSGILLAIHSRSRISITIALLAAVSGSYPVTRFMREAPPAYTEFSTYNHFFNALLPFSPSPEHDLKEFGLDASFLAYSGTTYFQTQSAFNNPEAMRTYRTKVTPGNIVAFYFHHPLRILSGARRAVSTGLALRPPYGNYEKKAGKPAGAHSEGFIVWSSIRETVLPRQFWFVALVLAVSFGCALWPRKSACATGLFLLFPFLCALQLGMIACASDPSDMVRHMFLFNLLLDITLLIASIELISYLGSRFMASEVVEEGN